MISRRSADRRMMMGLVRRMVRIWRSLMLLLLTWIPTLAGMLFQMMLGARPRSFLRRRLQGVIGTVLERQLQRGVNFLVGIVPDSFFRVWLEVA